MKDFATEVYERLENKEEIDLAFLTEGGYVLYTMKKSDIESNNFTLENLQSTLDEIVDSLEENMGDKVTFVLLAVNRYEPHEGELDSDNEWGHLLN